MHVQNLSDHIMDIAQNAIRANATRVEIDVEESEARDALVLVIRDNGDGMDADTVQRVTDPFFTSRTTRKVGLGVPLLKQNAEATGGRLSIRSAPGKGTAVEATFSRSHLDRPPVGDIAGTIVLLAAANPGMEVRYRYVTDKGTYTFSSGETRTFLGDTPLDDPEIVAALREMIAENIKDIQV
ncbi:MAG: sensor histidine kinase [Odoribacteraceae bacterium]|nr:sensor histidine kinase [Odoribacteraceae bacterium]